MTRRASQWPTSSLLALLLAGGCGETSGDAPEVSDASPDPDAQPLEPPDDPQRYVDDVAYGRAILERDLRRAESDYANERLEFYGIDGEGWSALPERDLPSLPLTVEDVARAVRGEPFEFDDEAATVLTPSELPQGSEAWQALGRRVFFEYPLRADPVNDVLVTLDGGLEQAGFLRDGEAYVGLRLFRDPPDRIRVGNTCAQCHASRDAQGEFSGTLSNREMDVGVSRLLGFGYTPGNLPAALSSTQKELEKWGPGRADLFPDEVLNPLAYPDLGGIAQMPYLQHNANWFNRGTATLAVRCETLFITSNFHRSRIPRVLSWAIASYFRGLAPPAPLDAPNEASARGEGVFKDAGCHTCHPPPLFTSDREVSVEEIGTDPAAGLSRLRFTGLYRIPSLRGVGRMAPYFHHGAVSSLEALFEPDRREPGHVFGTELDASDRAALVAYLRTL